jgi:hypothetical protein
VKCESAAASSVASEPDSEADDDGADPPKDEARDMVRSVVIIIISEERAKSTVEMVEMVEAMDRSLSHKGQLGPARDSTTHSATYSFLSCGFRGELIMMVPRRVRGKAQVDGRGWRRPMMRMESVSVSVQSTQRRLYSFVTVHQTNRYDKERLDQDQQANEKRSIRVQIISLAKECF